MMEKRMKAWTQSAYGKPSDVLELKEVEIPLLKEGEILVKVNTISLNPAELHKILGEIWFMRPIFGIRKPKSPYLGADLMGEIVAIKNQNSAFKIGDMVLGRSHHLGIADFAILKEENASLVKKEKPSNSLAALPLAFSTAYHSLIEAGKLKQNEKVLINGASGGIGTIMMQLAIDKNARITAVSSKKNHPLLKTLGAEECIDYNQDKAFVNSQGFDLVVDLVGNLSIRQINQMLHRNGRAVMVGFTSPKLLFGYLFGKKFLKKENRKYSIVNAEVKTKLLDDLQELIAEKRIEPIIDTTYGFNEVPIAFEQLNSKRVVGKILIKVNS